MKQCNRCKEVKGVGEFSKNKSRVDGLQRNCKQCANVVYKEYARANPEKVRERARKSGIRWRKANHEKARAKNKRWRKANPEKMRELVLRWRKGNQRKVREMSRRYSKRKRAELSDSYVAKLLGLPVTLLREKYPGLLECKRAQIKLLRAIKE